MKRFPSIRKNTEFQKIYRTGRSRANHLLVMYIRENAGQGVRIGISASKRIGNSVVRHRLTRLIREAFRLHLFRTESGYDIVTVVRPAAAGKTYQDMEKAYLHLLKLHGILTEKNNG